MRITKKHFNSILLELIDENPIASRGILRISQLEFTTAVPTLAIAVTGQPKLYVNLGFVKKHCRTETDVKAVIIHEFLHVLLNHTEKFKRVTPALNWALDAVINAIIHRSLGSEYSGMMSRYYRNAVGALKLLRPMTKCEADARWDFTDPIEQLWFPLYNGALVADDLLEISAKLENSVGNKTGFEDGAFLGNHQESSQDEEEISVEVEDVIRNTLSSINGKGVWRNPAERGVGISSGETVTPATERSLALWEKEALKVLNECVTPDKNFRFDQEEAGVLLPVLNENDKRGLLRSMWSPFLPEIVWKTRKKVRTGTTQIYLDVSGSMNDEMDALVALIWRLRRHIRFPFWAFSDSVEPAVIRNGTLVTMTTGGTSMDSVLKHVAATRPAKAVVITDGYIEDCDPKLLSGIRDQKICAIVSRDGSTAKLERSGIPYWQLGRFDYDQNG